MFTYVYWQIFVQFDIARHARTRACIYAKIKLKDFQRSIPNLTEILSRKINVLHT